MVGAAVLASWMNIELKNFSSDHVLLRVLLIQHLGQDGVSFWVRLGKISHCTNKGFSLVDKGRLSHPTSGSKTKSVPIHQELAKNSALVLARTLVAGTW